MLTSQVNTNSLVLMNLVLAQLIQTLPINYDIKLSLKID